MAGSIPLSLSQQLDSLGKPLSNGLLYFFAAGTTTPQNAYQDYALTLAYPNPLILDSAGRIPYLFFADGQIKIRLTDSRGNIQLAADNLLIVGASAGTGTPPTVDPTTVLQTGMLVKFYGTGVVTGFVRLNGRTIGSATSGATERANADTQNLFTFLYNADPNLSVSGGRGASAAADWAANKTLNLPDGRGRSLSNLDDMGSTAAGRYSGASISGSATTLGATISNSVTLGTTNLPAYTPSGSVSVAAPGHNDPAAYSGNATIGNGSLRVLLANSTNASGFDDVGSHNAGTNNSTTGTFTGTAQGGTSTPFTTFAPAILVTTYLKL